jgi:hypothetical protein
VRRKTVSRSVLVFKPADVAACFRSVFRRWPGGSQTVPLAQPSWTPAGYRIGRPESATNQTDHLNGRDMRDAK